MAQSSGAQFERNDNRQWEAGTDPTAHGAPLTRTREAAAAMGGSRSRPFGNVERADERTSDPSQTDVDRCRREIAELEVSVEKARRM